MNAIQELGVKSEQLRRKGVPEKKYYKLVLKKYCKLFLHTLRAQCFPWTNYFTWLIAHNYLSTDIFLQLVSHTTRQAVLSPFPEFAPNCIHLLLLINTRRCINPRPVHRESTG